MNLDNQIPRREKSMRFDKWAVTAQEALQSSVSIAADAEAGEVRPIHLLKALLQSNERNITAIIERVGADPAQVEAQVDQTIAHAPRVTGDMSQMSISNELRRVGDEAEKLASKLGDSYVTSEHLLCALADEKGDAGSALRGAGITGKRVQEAFNDLRGDERVTSQDAKTQFEALEQYGRNVTDLARQGKLDPVIGRVEEIRRTIQVLSRRTKNNPVLIGEPGVGKTAIVEGLAERIAAGDVPSTIKDKEVVELDMSALVAWRQVPRRVRGPPQERAEGGPEGKRQGHPLHRRAAHHRGRRRDRGLHGRRQHPEAGPGPWRAAHDRCDDAGRVPQVHREGPGPCPPLPDGVRV
jgi:ATP-dependent Clp protease ATP-binding subunit ClpB